MKTLVLTALTLLGVVAPAWSQQGAGELAERARVERRAGRFGAAAELLTRGGAARSDDPELVGLLGLCLLDSGDGAGALDLAERHAGYAGDGFRLHLFLGRLDLERGQLEPAEQHLERAVALKDGAVEALLSLGEVLRRLERTSRGLEVAAALGAARPELGRRLEADLHAARGARILERSARNPEAVPRALEAYAQAYELVPDDDLLAAQLLDLLIQSHRAPEAEALVERVHPLELRPVEHHLYLGRVAMVANAPARAEQHYRTVLGLRPGHADGSVGLARLLVDAGRGAEADALLLELLERVPGLGEAQLVLGLSAVAADDPARAEPHLRQAVALRPQDPEALYQLGRVLMRTGQVAEGRQVLARYRDG